jgi:hypothetical protein
MMALPSLIVIIAPLLATLASGSPENQPTPPENQRAEEKTALLSSRDRHCELTERSPPFAFVAFALQMDGEIHYYRTKTDCSDFPYKTDLGDPIIFGEQVTIFGDTEPVAIRRENGKLYQLTRGRPISMFFSPKLNDKGNTTIHRFYNENPHPDLAIAECRLLQSSFERDRCLRYQADFELDLALCEEMAEPRREKCRLDIKEIQDMLASRGPIFRSPNGRCEAFYQERRHPGGSHTHAQVVLRCQERGLGRVIFTADGKNVPVTIHWIGDEELKISYPPTAKFTFQAPSRSTANGPWGKIAIVYESLRTDE